jgi:Sulfotransferase family
MRAGGKLESPWGEVWGHDHRFRFADVDADHKAVIPLRDPVARFLSGFYSRLRKGAPRHLVEWTDEERRSFESFPTPQALADALAQPSGRLREQAELAMRSIGHLKYPMTHWTGTPDYVAANIDRVLYVARQETLDEDWEALKEILDLPRDQQLPTDAVTAHRTDYAGSRDISADGIRALRAWYADDYELLEIGERVRRESGVSPAASARRLPARPTSR